MPSKIERQIKDSGFCCPFYFFSVSGFQSSQELADELDCTKRSVQLWRKKYKRGELECQEKKTCKE